MRHAWMVVLALAGPAWAQEGEKRREGEKAPGPMLRVEQVDVNGDGWISAAELKAALRKLGGGGEAEGGVKKPGLKDGEGPRKEGPRDGEKPRKEGPRDGEGPRKEGERER